MKLSGKIFCGIVGLAICSMMILGIIIEVGTKHKTSWSPFDFLGIRNIVTGNNYNISNFVSMPICKVIEVGNNWNITILDNKSLPTRTTAFDYDTTILFKICRIHLRHFDSTFIQDAKAHIEIRNDTLKFKDIDRKFRDCNVYVTPSFREIKIEGNSTLYIHKTLDFENRYDRQCEITLKDLTIKSFDDTYVYINNTHIDNLSMYTFNQSRINFHSYSPSIRKIELHDYSRVDIYNPIVLSEYLVEDNASLIFHNKFAASKKNVICLKGEYK